MSYEYSTDLQVVGSPVTEAFRSFAKETSREIKLEIEPGTFLVANSGVLLSTVQDIVSTGAGGGPIFIGTPAPDFESFIIEFANANPGLC